LCLIHHSQRVGPDAFQLRCRFGLLLKTQGNSIKHTRRIALNEPADLPHIGRVSAGDLVAQIR
jgi:hypothetical protein